MSNGQRFHMVAILHRGHTPICVRSNSSKTSPRFARTGRDGSVGHTLHAEMAVLHLARPGDEIEIMRWRRDGTLAMARPCTHCQYHLKRSGVHKVVYSDNNGQMSVLRLD